MAIVLSIKPGAAQAAAGVLTNLDSYYDATTGG